MTKWQLDKKIEEKVAAFTDKYFWSKLPCHREEALSAQYAGIDVQLSCNNKITNFDEKAKIRGCLNSVLQYPSFELEFTNKAGNRQDGWFLSDKIYTDYYAFIAVFATTTDENQLTANNAISAIDMLWVKKSDVKDMVQEQMSDQQLKDDIEEIKDDLDAQCCGKARKRYPHGKFWLTYSANLKEQPINLVTKRESLEKLPHTRHFYITKTKIERK